MPAIVAKVTLRPERPEDEEFLFALYASTRQEELDAWGWPREMRRTFLEVQFRAQQRYRTAFPKAQFRIVEMEGRCIGRLIVDSAADELRLVDIALLREQRNAGLGTQLIRGIQAEGRAAGKPVRLTVQKGHRAERLYGRLGFVKISETELHEDLEWRPDAARD
jgi:GNAT superfamily N-acetyltransferase